MTCPGCARPNKPERRFCGGCGTNLEPVCRACAFANDADDKFCGGCGVTLRAEAAPRVVAVVKPAPGGELVGLFAKAPKADAPAKLPDSGVSQGDLDKLFGGQG